MKTNKDNLVISTAEQISFNYKISGLGSRSIAFLLDYSIRLILILFFAVFFYVLSRIFPSIISLDSIENISKTWLLALGFLLYGILYLGYFLLFEALWAGQTPGKRIIGLRVVKVGGQPIGWLESAVRNILRAIDMLFGFYPIGLIVMFLSPNGRRIGDYAAGTLVIFARRINVPMNRARLPRLSGPYITDMELNISSVTPEEYEVMKSFLQRRENMDKSHRSMIAKTLADRLKEKWKMSMEDISHEKIIEDVVSVYEMKKRAI